MDALTDQQAAILEFEGTWWTHAAGKEQAIAELFGLSATDYYQRLTTLIDEPAACAASPLVVRRLRRVREGRLRARSARRVG
jgi:hypothetical protein